MSCTVVANLYPMLSFKGSLNQCSQHSSDEVVTRVSYADWIVHVRATGLLNENIYSLCGKCCLSKLVLFSVL